MCPYTMMSGILFKCLIAKYICSFCSGMDRLALSITISQISKHWAGAVSLTWSFFGSLNGLRVRPIT